MTITLTARQQRLVNSEPKERLTLFVLTTYSDHTVSPKTVFATHFWSEHYVEYDWENTGTLRQFLPYVLKADAQMIETMPHLPSGQSIEGELVRPYRLTLLNRIDEGDSGYNDYLIFKLRNDTLEFADLVVAELLLDPSVKGGENPKSLVGDEHQVLYRGQLHRIEAVTEDTITIEFERERIENVLPAPIVGGQMALRDLGKRPPVPYGFVKRVPCLGVNVGATTTTAVPISNIDNFVELSDASSFPATGLCYIGGEKVTWNSKSGDRLLNLTRPTGEGEAIAHQAGELVVEITDEVIYVVGDGNSVSRVTTAWIQSPETFELLRLPNAGLFVANDTLALPGNSLSTIRWNQTAWTAMLETIVSNSRVTQQARIEDPTDPITVTPDDFIMASIGGTSREIIQGQEGWISPGGASGTFSSGGALFSYDRNETQRKFVYGISSGPSFFPQDVATTDVFRARLHLAFFSTLVNVDRVEVTVEVFPVGVTNSPLYGLLPPLTVIVTPSNFFGDGDGPFISDPGGVGSSTVLEGYTEWEYHVTIRTFEPGFPAPVPTVNIEIFALDVEFEYIATGNGSLLEPLTDVAIRAFSGGAGVELFADVEGATVPTQAFTLGYDFSDQNFVNGFGLDDSDIPLARRFLIQDPWLVWSDLDGDAAEWDAPINDTTVTNATPASSNPSLLLTMPIMLLHLHYAPTDATNWSGAFVSDVSANPGLGINFAPTGSGTTYTERTVTSDDWTHWWLHFLASISSAQSSNITSFRLRLHSGVDFWEWSWLVPSGLSWGWIITTDLKVHPDNPSEGGHLITTSGSPDKTIIDKIAIGLEHTSSANVDFIETSIRRSDVAANARNIFAPAEDWSNFNMIRFKVFIPTNAAFPLGADRVKFVLIRIGSSATDFHQFQWDAPAEIPLDTEIQLLFNVVDNATMESDPHFHTKSGTTDLANIDRIFFFFSDVDPLGPKPGSGFRAHVAAEVAPDMRAYFADIEFNNSVLTSPAVAGIAIAALDMDVGNDRYELELEVDSVAGFGTVEIRLSEETPAAPTDALTNYKKIVIPYATFQFAGRGTTSFTSVDVGTPGTLDAVRTIQVVMISAQQPLAKIDLYTLKKGNNITAYLDAQGAVIQHPCDVVRHLLEERLGLGNTVIDETNWALAETNLGTNKVSVVLEELGFRFYEIVGRLGFEHRFQLVSQESATVTFFRMLTAKTDHKYPLSPVSPITDWQDIVQNEVRFDKVYACQ